MLSTIVAWVHASDERAPVLRLSRTRSAIAGVGSGKDGVRQLLLRLIRELETTPKRMRPKRIIMSLLDRVGRVAIDSMGARAESARRSRSSLTMPSSWIVLESISEKRSADFKARSPRRWPWPLAGAALRVWSHLPRRMLGPRKVPNPLHDLLRPSSRQAVSVESRRPAGSAVRRPRAIDRRQSPTVHSSCSTGAGWRLA
jgi:hypothetical protein